MAKLPALQFYPGDWRKDVGVQSLSYHDRGVWFEMLMLMHESEQRGYLMLGGQAMPDEVLASILHLSIDTLTETLFTLVSRGVTHRDKRTNAFVNRRMVRDEIKRADDRCRLERWRKTKKLKGNGNAPETPDETLNETERKRLSSSSYLGIHNSAEITDPSVATRVVLERCGLSKTRAFLEAVGDQAKLAHQAGDDLLEWGESAIKAYLDYSEAKPLLDFPLGAEKFFATGLYRHRELWKYKNGAPNGKRKYYQPEMQ